MNKYLRLHKMDETAAPSSKRLKTSDSVYNVKINDIYIQHESTFSEAFCSRENIKLDNGFEVITSPFKCCILPDFIQPNDYLEELKKELTQLDMEKNINDLYQFRQSKDLMNFSSPCISKFKEILQEDILKWMKTVTNIPLSGKTDMFCSNYSYTDYLLCHDDQLEGRRIAYIFYLVPDWNETDGGSLDLFDTTDHITLDPSDICKSIIPKWNNFVFFEVSPISYHQVAEVLSSKERIALSGWFYGPSLESSIRLGEINFFEKPREEYGLDITKWINPMYFDAKTQLDIREAFEDSSEISLPDFLIAEKYERVCKALTENIDWSKKGPPNLRTTYEMEDDDIPPILKTCRSVFTSEGFLLILSNLTALKLHPACEEGTQFGEVSSCIRKWCPGSYTLLHNTSFSQITSLDSFLYFNCQEWDTECGGYASFIANGENDELLRVEPNPNSLALVYTTGDTSHFVKYINSKAKKQQTSVFYDIYCKYIERTNYND